MADLDNIKGLDALQRLLDELPAKMEASIVRGGLRAGARVIQAAAQDSTAFADRTGELRKSIRVSTGLRRGKVSAKVKAGSKKAWYARLVEGGTKAHMIKPRHRKSLLLAGVLREVVDHPGARAKPFMRPALDAHAFGAVMAAADYMRARLTKEGVSVPDPGQDTDPEDAA